MRFNLPSCYPHFAHLVQIDHDELAAGVDGEAAAHVHDADLALEPNASAHLSVEPACPCTTGQCQ